MPTDRKDTVLPLTHASILVEFAGEVRRFRVYTAVLLPPSQMPLVSTPKWIWPDYGK
jgi:hypothetical protein